MPIDFVPIQMVCILFFVITLIEANKLSTYLKIQLLQLESFTQK